MLKAAHYTSFDSLFKIIETGTLWASNIIFLNDKTEFLHGINSFFKFLPNADIPIEHNEFCLKDYLSFMDTIFSDWKPKDNTYPSDQLPNKATIDDFSPPYNFGSFICSFSLLHNDLSQWRGYCNYGKGCNVIYDLDEIITEIKKMIPKAFISKCVYRRKTKERLFNEFLIKHLDDYIEFHENDSCIKHSIAYNIKSDFIKLILCFKHFSFRMEKEVRIIIPNYSIEDDKHKLLDLRIANNCVIPYLKLPVPKNYLRIITIGPSPNLSHSRHSLKMFINSRFSDFDNKPHINDSTNHFRAL